MLTMKSIDEQILRTTKEIVVKFIEMSRLSPTSVHDAFRDIHATVKKTVKGDGIDQDPETKQDK